MIQFLVELRHEIVACFKNKNFFWESNIEVLDKRIVRLSVETIVFLYQRQRRCHGDRRCSGQPGGHWYLLERNYIKVIQSSTDEKN